MPSISFHKPKTAVSGSSPQLPSGLSVSVDCWPPEAAPLGVCRAPPKPSVAASTSIGLRTPRTRARAAPQLSVLCQSTDLCVSARAVAILPLLIAWHSPAIPALR